MDLIPIVLGIFCCFACLGVGFVYGVFFAKGASRWYGLLIGAVGLVGLLPLLIVLPPSNVSLDSLSGAYEGRFGGGKHTFILRPNGKYEQRFVTDSGKIYKNSGTWQLDAIQTGHVDFNHLLVTVDGSGKPQAPHTVNFGGASLIGASIYFNEDVGIAITRIIDKSD